MSEQAIETYPTYDGLGDIISETRAWYRALGLLMGGSLYSVIRATEGVTGLVHAIAKTLKLKTSKKVHVVVEDTPSIAYVVFGNARTVVHVGSWLYNREKMTEFIPAVSAMSENDMLVLSLGLINGAIALDMMASATEATRNRSIIETARKLSTAYADPPGDDWSIWAVDAERAMLVKPSDVDERYVYISSAIHDIIAIKTRLANPDNSSWIVFPILLFRALFSNDFAHYAKELIEQDDTVDNLLACVSALRCFSSHSASILEVKTSVGINLIRALLAGATDSAYDNSSDVSRIVSEEMLSAYIKELKKTQSKQQKQDAGAGEDEEKQKKEKQDKKNKESSEDKSYGEDGLVKGIEASDPSTPVSESVARTRAKQISEFEDFYDNGEENLTERERADRQESLSLNKKVRLSDAGDKRDWLESFMQVVFSGRVKFNNQAPRNIPPMRSFKNVAEYIERMKEEGYGGEDIASCGNGRESLPKFAENVTAVYNSIDKTSLNNLFMERTMDIEKSQPARAGIAFIPTRVANIFTDEKVFSPLPENMTERNSEVIVLVDTSGSMRGHDIAVIDNEGRSRYMPLYDAVVGAARAIADGLQRANVECSVFAHSTFFADDGAFICKITDPYSFDRQNDFINSGKLKSMNNADGYAIEEVAKYFNQDGHDIGRTLIVLSDGQPAFSGYVNGRDGEKHTKEAVDKLREEGINVYSVSLVNNVIESNNDIYGEKHNLCPADERSHDVISLSSMLKKIVDVVSVNSPRSANNVLTQG